MSDDDLEYRRLVKLLRGGPATLDEALEAIGGEWALPLALARSTIRVSGLDKQGRRVAIDPAVFLSKPLRGPGNSLTTGDFRLSWSAVMVELAKPATPARPRGYDDGAILAELRLALASGDTIQKWVIENDKRIGGATVGGKVRRLQKKIRANAAN